MPVPEKFKYRHELENRHKAEKKITELLWPELCFEIKMTQKITLICNYFILYHLLTQVQFNMSSWNYLYVIIS